MGQYYVVANLDKKEILHPHAFGDGLKLLEFGCSSGSTMTGLAVLLATSNGRGGGDLTPSEGKHEYLPGTGKFTSDKKYLAEQKKIQKVAGRWAGDRIAVVGDYSDKENPREFAEAYKGEESGYTDISALVIEALRCDSYLNKQFAENPFYERMKVARASKKAEKKEVST